MKIKLSFLFTLALFVTSVNCYAQSNGGTVSLPSDLTYLELAQVGTANEYRIRIASSSKGCVFRYATMTVNPAFPRNINGTWTLSRSSDYMDDDTNYMYSSAGNFRYNPNGTITFTYKRTDTQTGWPVYDVTFNITCYVYADKWYYQKQSETRELKVHSHSSTDISTDNITDLTDDGISISTTDIDSYIDNTGADAEWKYWSFTGKGTGSDNKQYSYTIKYKASSTLGSFASSLADAEVTSLSQGSTKIEWTYVETKVEEYKTGNYMLVATFIDSNGKKYYVTADFADDCVATDDGGTQGNVPCTAYFTLDQMSMTSQKTLGSKMCDADWKTGSGWSKTFTVLQATNTDGASVKLFFSDISTKSYNSITAPTSDDYLFAKAELANDMSNAGSTSCFNSTEWENLYYFGFVYDLSGTTYTLYSSGFSDYSNVAVGQGEPNPYIGSQAYFPGAYSDPENDYVYASYHKICPYWSYYVCPNSNEKIYFDSDDIIHVEQKSDGNVFIQVRDKDDASMVYVQIGTATVDQGGTEGGGTVTPTIKLDTYVNGRGSVTVSPEECLYTEGTQITLTPNPEDDWTFTGWTGDCANQITDNGNGTYTYTVPAYDCAVIANFTEGISYTVTFQDYDLTELQSGTMAEGQLPVYNGPTPERPQDERYTYTFTGWYDGTDLWGPEVALPAVTADVTYMATYSSEQRLYTIIFNNDDNTELWRGYFVYDVNPSYGGDTPTKEANPGYVYRFTGWTDGVNEYPVGTNLPKVTGDAAYRAMFVEEVAYYNVRFENYDGSELQTLQLGLNEVPAYEGTPVRENDGDEYNWYEFTFTGWTDAADNTYAADAALPAVTGDITYTAQYSKKLFIILQENMDADYYTDFHNKYNTERATTATLNRQFGQGKWSTLCLPFDVPAGQLTALGLMNRVFEFKYTKGEEQSGLTLYFSQAKKLAAGKGYIVNANATLAKKLSFGFSNALINTSSDEQSGFDIANLEGYNSQGYIYLVGTLRTGTLYVTETGNSYMGLKDNKIYYPNSTQGTTVRAYRGIFRNAGEEALPARVRIVAENEDGQTVSELEVVNGSLEEASPVKKYMDNGILYIERNGERYDAQGQRVE